MTTTIPESENSTQAQEQLKSNGEKKLMGFALHPENINRTGLNKREWTWKNLLEEAAEEEQLLKDGNKIKWKRLIAKKLFHEAAKGNVHAIRELMDRMDGKAIQPHEVEHSGEITISFHNSLKQSTENGT